jgi:ligand-binding sensor domain-containing protein
MTNRVIISLAFDNSGRLYAGTRGNGIFRSADYGDSWRAASTGLRATSVYAVMCNASSQLFAGTDAGVFISVDNGSSWCAINGGLSNTVVLSFAKDSPVVFAGTGGSGVFRLQ